MRCWMFGIWHFVEWACFPVGIFHDYPNILRSTYITIRFYKELSTKNLVRVSHLLSRKIEMVCAFLWRCSANKPNIAKQINYFGYNERDIILATTVKWNKEILHNRVSHKFSHSEKNTNRWRKYDTKKNVGRSRARARERERGRKKGIKATLHKHAYLNRQPDAKKVEWMV